MSQVKEFEAKSFSVHQYQIESQRQFWVKQKRIVQLLCQAKGDTVG